MRRLLVFGSRTWGEAPRNRPVTAASAEKAEVERAFLFATLDAYHAKTGVACLIEGEAIGADKHAARWADSRERIKVDPYPVTPDEWRRFGDRAGPRRNERMHREGKPDEAIGFISGKVGTPFSRGSAGMVAICRKAGTPLTVYREDGIEVLR